MSKTDTQTSTVGPTGATKGFVNNWQTALSGLFSQLAGATPVNYQAARDQLKGDFADQRTAAIGQSADLATRAGAYGGDRAAILQSQMQNDVNKNEARTLANFDLSAGQDQWSRLLGVLGMFGPAAQAGAYRTTNKQTRGPGTALAGLGLMGAGALTGNPLPFLDVGM